MTRPFNRARSGFTLLEVLVAVSLIAALVGMMFAFTADLLGSRERLQEHASRQRAATTLIDRLEADLSMCVVGGGKAGAGIHGDGHSLRILTRGLALAEAEHAADAAGLGDLQIAEYRFDSSRHLVEGRRGAMSSRAAAVPPFTALGGTVHDVSFRYHDGKAWREEFDSLRERRLPQAIEVAIWFEAPAAFSPDAVEGEGIAIENDSDFRPTFDEAAVAMKEARHGVDQPRPDRVRVVLIFDSEPGESESAPSTGASEENPA